MDALIPELAPDFSDPLGLLLACHQRMREHCELLQRYAQRLSDKGLDEDAIKATTQVHRYFSTAALFHHRDEEDDLFPLLAQPARIENPAAFLEPGDRFASLYQKHLAYEEQEFLNSALHMLSQEQLERIGHSMKKRRQAN